MVKARCERYRGGKHLNAEQRTGNGTGSKAMISNIKTKLKIQNCNCSPFSEKHMNGLISGNPTPPARMAESSLSFLSAKQFQQSGYIPAQRQSNRFYGDWPCLWNHISFPSSLEPAAGTSVFSVSSSVSLLMRAKHRLFDIQATVEEFLRMQFRCHLEDFVTCVFDCTYWIF